MANLKDRLLGGMSGIVMEMVPEELMEPLNEVEIRQRLGDYMHEEHIPDRADQNPAALPDGSVDLLDRLPA